MTAHHLYFHIPFCVRKCNYCTFYSVPGGGLCHNGWDNLKNQLLDEISYWAEKVGPVSVPSIFFGGGTPSLMPVDFFREIMGALKDKFNIQDDCEITIECNPGTVTQEKLGEFQKIGMNRISVGVQSLDDSQLEFLGRIHNVQTATELIQFAKNIGLCVSADFIYGLPGQDIQDVKEICEKINLLGLDHCSMYELTIEPGTPFATLAPIDNELSAQMYETIGKNLKLDRYEVSNYGKPCKHNLGIWDGEPYIGFGPSAAGRPYINGTWSEQKNGKLGAPMEKSLLSPSERATEILITGLRTKRGVAITPDVLKIIDMDFAKNSGYFWNCDGRIGVKDFLLLDSLTERLII